MPIHLPVLQALSTRNTHYRTKEAAKTDCRYCRSPCCQLMVELRPDEVDKYEHVYEELNGEVKPFLKRREEDGYCVYYVHGKGCYTYEDKPYVCDYYSCREDNRITPSKKYGKIKPVV